MVRLTKRTFPLLCALLALGACHTDPPPKPTAVVPLESCRVPRATKELEAVLCAADQTRLSEAVDDTFSITQPALSLGQEYLTEDELSRRVLDFWNVQYEVLYKTFTGDRSVGTDLPWDALMTPEFRTDVAKRVALGVRNGHTDYSLAEIGEYARGQLREEAPTPRAVTISLLGAADVPDLVEILTPYLRNDWFRFDAARGLSLSCQPEAMQALLAARQDTGFRDEDSAKRLDGILDEHRRFVSHWCKLREAAEDEAAIP